MNDGNWGQWIGPHPLWLPSMLILLCAKHRATRISSRICQYIYVGIGRWTQCLHLPTQISAITSAGLTAADAQIVANINRGLYWNSIETAFTHALSRQETRRSGQLYFKMASLRRDDADYRDHVRSRNPSINHRGRLAISLFLLLRFVQHIWYAYFCLRFVWQ